MKHTTKKITAFVLTVLLIIGMIPSIAIPATAEVSPTSGSCGENATWELDTATGTLTISGTGIITDNDKQGTPWLDLNKKITKISIQMDNGGYLDGYWQEVAIVKIPEVF